MNVLKQKIKIKSRMHGLAMIAIFIFAQLLITFHHIDEPHVANEDSVAVECDICTVSPGAFDLAPHTYAPTAPALVRNMTPCRGDTIHISERTCSGYARAPPRIL